MQRTYKTNKETMLDTISTRSCKDNLYLCDSLLQEYMNIPKQ